MKKFNPWMFVALTCLFELLWVYGFNTASKGWQWGLVLAGRGLDFYFLFRACQSLPTGTVYAVFAAVGAAGTVLMDRFLFQEPLSAGQVICMAILVSGVVILKLSDEKPSSGGAL